MSVILARTVGTSRTIRSSGQMASGRVAATARATTLPSHYPYDLFAWYKADFGTFQTSGFATAAAADADPVGGWRDCSGHGRRQSQATSTKRPLLKLAIQNSLPVLRFDGTDDFLQGANAYARTVESVFVVASISTSAAADVCFVGDSATGNYTLRRRTTPVSEWGVAGFTDGTTGLRSATDVGTGAFFVLSAVRSVADNVIALYKNGTLLKTTTHTSGTVSTNIVIGQRLGGVPENFYGDIGEVVFFTRMLPANVRQAIESYLMTRWGIA